ncbi:hypothetical protein Sjap_024095 [Stephania japonica]|uniref:Casparian strip membrane protein domain-containing protein n=1 Tax=Stephania japonica TaxID=461633 RepID=A0AAP0EI40_9MAGN
MLVSLIFLVVQVVSRVHVKLSQICLWNTHPIVWGSLLAAEDLTAMLSSLKLLQVGRRWNDVAKVRAVIRERGGRRSRGSSWIELSHVIREFVIGDDSHVDSERSSMTDCNEQPEDSKMGFINASESLPIERSLAQPHRIDLGFDISASALWRFTSGGFVGFNVRQISFIRYGILSISSIPSTIDLCCHDLEVKLIVHLGMNVGMPWFVTSLIFAAIVLCFDLGVLCWMQQQNNPPNLRGKKCKIFDWLCTSKLVGEGEIETDDSMHLVDGIPIGGGAYLVYVERVFESNAFLWRNQNNWTTLDNALGEIIPWPKEAVAIAHSSRTIMILGEGLVTCVAGLFLHLSTKDAGQQVFKFNVGQGSVIKGNDFSCFGYLDFGCGLSALSALSLGCFLYSVRSINPGRKNYFTIFVINLVVVGLALTGSSAATAMGYVGRYGDSHAGWMPSCGTFGRFCDRIAHFPIRVTTRELGKSSARMKSREPEDILLGARLWHPAQMRRDLCSEDEDEVEFMSEMHREDMDICLLCLQAMLQYRTLLSRHKYLPDSIEPMLIRFVPQSFPQMILSEVVIPWPHLQIYFHHLTLPAIWTSMSHIYPAEAAGLLQELCILAVDVGCSSSILNIGEDWIAYMNEGDETKDLHSKQEQEEKLVKEFDEHKIMDAQETTADEEEMYAEEEGQLSWFNEGVRVGIGLGVGLSIGVAIVLDNVVALLVVVSFVVAYYFAVMPRHNRSMDLNCIEMS